jgi:ribosomal protein S18 acetylase RimI-like enzyme
MIAWLSNAVGIDVRSQQHDSDAELDSLSTFYLPPAGVLLLGYVDDTACGTTGVAMLGPETAELRRVWVSPRWRGHGLASRLLQGGIEAARQLGARSLVLETAAGHMDPAIGMYRRAGFRPVSPYSSLPETAPGILTLGLSLA